MASAESIAEPRCVKGAPVARHRQHTVQPREDLEGRWAWQEGASCSLGAAEG